MAAPLSLDVISRVLSLRPVVNPHSFRASFVLTSVSQNLRLCTRFLTLLTEERPASRAADEASSAVTARTTDLLQWRFKPGLSSARPASSSSSLASSWFLPINRSWQRDEGPAKFGLRLVLAPILGKGLPALTPATCFLVPSRNYGHKRRQNPMKIVTFDYSGDLRKLPELDKEIRLHTYQDMEEQIEGDTLLEKLTSLEFATRDELAQHRLNLVEQRIQAMFGPDSLLEQKIARQTLIIRRMIMHCLKFKQDKLGRRKLDKTIYCRRKNLNFLRRIDHERFEWLLKELKIRYIIPSDRVEYKGWKYNLLQATQEQTDQLMRDKLQALKDKFDQEKVEFYAYKSQVLAQIDQDLQNYGLTRDYLNSLAGFKPELDKNVTTETAPQQSVEGTTATTMRNPKVFLPPKNATLTWTPKMLKRKTYS